MKKWEYTEETDLFPLQLNEMGENGWELVTVVYRQNYKAEHLYVFKRPLPEPLTMAPIGPPTLPF